MKFLGVIVIMRDSLIRNSEGKQNAVLEGRFWPERSVNRNLVSVGTPVQIVKKEQYRLARFAQPVHC